MKKYIIILFIFISILSCNNYKNDENIVISLGGEVATIDPHLNTANIGTVYIRHFFEGLMKKDKDGKIIPGMAERYEMSDDGLVYTFYLRTNAKWSDGKNFTADDFLYSYRRFVDPKTAAPYGHLMKPIKNALKITKGEIPVEELGIKKIDDYTLEITLENPTAYFLELADMYLPVRKDIIEEYGNTWVLNPESYICNGPYKMKERIIDDKIVMEINSNYYDYDKLVAKNITIKMISDRNTALAGVRNGDIHFSNLVPPQEVEELRKEKLIVMNQAYGTVFFEINLTNKAFTDSRVRKALALAIDRNYLVNTVNKSGEIPAGAFVPPLIDDYEGKFRQNGGDYLSVDINDYQKNIEEAKRLMAEAGYPNGDNFPVLEFYLTFNNDIPMFEAIQNMWKVNLGIDIKLIQMEFAPFINAFRTERNYTMAGASWTGSYNDPTTFLGMFVSYSYKNHSLFTNKAFDDEILIASKTIDQNIRMPALHRAEKILIEDEAVIIPIYYFEPPVLKSPNLKDVFYIPFAQYKFSYSYLEK